MWGLALVIAASQCGGYRDGVVAAWGESVEVWRADRTVAVGESPVGAVSRIELPPAALPADAIRGPVGPQRLSVPLLEGAVLTEAHLTAGGLAATLPADQRLMPVTVEPGWGVTTGSVVDVWAVDRGRGPPRLLAEARRVHAVSADARPVALVALPTDDVAAATEVLGTGQLLLTLAPGQ